MILSRNQLTPELVREVLNYDSNTGVLTWRSKQHSKRIVLHSRAGSYVPSTGYRSITLFGKSYPEHIICWYHYHGVWPTGQIDHKDQVRDHNWISNLQDISFHQNMLNRKALKGTVTGHQGIWFNKRTNRYVAQIVLNGKKVFQKSCKTANEALALREAKLIELGFSVNHGSEK